MILGLRIKLFCASLDGRNLNTMTKLIAIKLLVNDKMKEFEELIKFVSTGCGPEAKAPSINGKEEEAFIFWP
ncbi:hypothetical protein L596_018167 [Steinernema carpocapsae]|uniref:Uncharacterized protein n=1 Tax=Steinernema carpocapsae TaxID=34508 RepID=A0A4U5N4B7_STECR|nr:hypothetical protein L596_018167 [Steinernema carpocapsae]